VTRHYPLAREVQGIAYQLLAPLTSTQARFSFAGRFQNQELVRDATLLTLTQYHAGQPAPAAPVQRSPFMEIGDTTAHGRAIRLALDIAQIDEPAILRTIIMIRQYKRLHAGRHEFGEARVFAPR
jgi:hypothetical protein